MLLRMAGRVSTAAARAGSRRARLGVAMWYATRVRSGGHQAEAPGPSPSVPLSTAQVPFERRVGFCRGPEPMSGCLTPRAHLFLLRLGIVHNALIELRFFWLAAPGTAPASSGASPRQLGGGVRNPIRDSRRAA